MERNKHFDLMLAFGIIFVVMGHNFHPEYFFFPPHTFHIPLFFFISGYFFKIKTNLSEKKEWLISKVKSQLLIYFFFNLIFGLITQLINSYGIFAGNRITFTSFFIAPFYHSHQYLLYVPAWFLLQLFVTNTVLQGILWSKKNYFLLTALGLCLILNYYLLTQALKGLVDFELLVSRTVLSMLFVLLGLVFRRAESSIKPILVNPVSLIFLFIFVNFLKTNFGNISYSVLQVNVGNNLIFVPILSTISIILIVYILCYYISIAISPGSFIYKIGENTFSIMIWHFSILYLIKLCFLLSGKLYIGDFSNLYSHYKPEKFWFLYQIPAILIPVFAAEYFKSLKIKLPFLGKKAQIIPVLK